MILICGGKENVKTIIMNREDQISDASCNYVSNSKQTSNIVVFIRIDSFEDGANWADDNPKNPWISIIDDLPCNHKELIDPNCKNTTQSVLIAKADGTIRQDYMIKDFGTRKGWSWRNWGGNFVYWMPIPEPPKEKED